MLRNHRFCDKVIGVGKTNGKRASVSMERSKLLIVDSSEDFVRAVNRMMGQEFQICICRTGEEGLKMLREFQPDVLLVDMTLPETDGLTMLQTAYAQGLRTRVMATTWMPSPYIMESLQKLGVGYVMVKPCNPVTLAARLRELVEYEPWVPTGAAAPELTAEGMLQELGFNPRHDGFKYLRQCIQLTAYQPGALVTKELYPAVAQAMNATPIQVERNSRSAIEAAWKRGDRTVWEKYFPGMSRPSNGVLITSLAARLRR